MEIQIKVNSQLILTALFQHRFVPNSSSVWFSLIKLNNEKAINKWACGLVV